MAGVSLLFAAFNTYELSKLLPPSYAERQSERESTRGQ